MYEVRFVFAGNYTPFCVFAAPKYSPGNDLRQNHPGENRDVGPFFREYLKKLPHSLIAAMIPVLESPDATYRLG